MKVENLYLIDNIKCEYKIKIPIRRLYGVMKNISSVNVNEKPFGKTSKLCFQSIRINATVTTLKSIKDVKKSME